MELDVVIDIVCPWCFIGKRYLDRALAARPSAIRVVRYRPYQLSPDTPLEGVDRTAYYKKKFGDGPDVQQNRTYMTETGEALGIHFDFESPVLIANTLDAHRLLRWALSAGCQHAVADGLMRRYFEQAQFLGCHETLIDVAAEAGMDTDLVGKLLASDQDRELVAADVMSARQMGITGVPTFIFDRRLAVTGAQDSDVLIQAIDQALATAPPSAPTA